MSDSDGVPVGLEPQFPLPACEAPERSSIVVDEATSAISVLSPTWEELKEAGNVAFKGGRTEEAIAHYTAAIELSPGEAVLYSNRSAAHLRNNDYQKAMKDSRTAVTLDSTFAKGYMRLHTVLCNVGKFDEAAEVVHAGLERIRASPRSAWSDIEKLAQLEQQAKTIQQSVEQATAYIAAGNTVAAARCLEVGCRTFPQCAPLAFQLAEIRAPMHPEEVARSLVPFGKLHMSDPAYLHVRALSLYYLGGSRLSDAEAVLREALQLDPDNRKAQALFRLIRFIESKRAEGNAAFKKKEYSVASAAYTEAIDRDPTNKQMVAVLRANRAAARMELKEYAGALEDCDFALANGNATAKIHARRSRIHECLDKFDEAVRDLQRAAAMDRSYASELRQMEARAKKASRKDYYKILGLDPRETDEANVKRAYKKACLQWHPDKWANGTEEERAVAESKFKDVGEAFAVLSDPRKKHMYDNGQLDSDSEGGFGMRGGMHGVPEEFMAMFGMHAFPPGMGRGRGRSSNMPGVFTFYA